MLVFPKNAEKKASTIEKGLATPPNASPPRPTCVERLRKKRKERQPTMQASSPMMLHIFEIDK